ncbi:MAG: sel1 repeat family protein [Bacteroides sp.]|nr:sel1 repeat family protein [Bacteroides sp.]
MKFFTTLLLFSFSFPVFSQIDNKTQMIETFNQAQILTSGRKYSEAKELYITAYELGDHLLSPFQLGELFYAGLGVQQDIEEAVKWYKISADNGHPESSFYCGYAYNIGQGFPKDFAKALKYYYQASDYIPNANLRIGLLLREGLGEQKNEVKAYEYIKKGAEMGCAESQYSLAFGYLNGYGNLPVNKQKALTWMRKAADQGYVKAQIWLNDNK